MQRYLKTEEIEALAPSVAALVRDARSRLVADPVELKRKRTALAKARIKAQRKVHTGIVTAIGTALFWYQAIITYSRNPLVWIVALCLTAGTLVLFIRGAWELLLSATFESILPPQARKHRKPPLDAAFILLLLLEPQKGENLVGDLDERYVRVQKRIGHTRANWWYYAQVVRTLWSLLGSKGQQLVQTVAGVVWRHIVP